MRDLLHSGPTPAKYCKTLLDAGLPDYDCEARFRSMWHGVWEAIEARYDYVLLWGATPDVMATVPKTFVARISGAKLTLLVKAP